MILLSNTMSSGHGLQICLWIPVAIENDDRVGCFQIDSETSRSSREDESKIGRARGVEVFNRLAPHFRRNSAIQALIYVAPQSQVIRQDVTIEDSLGSLTYYQVIPGTHSIRTI